MLSCRVACIASRLLRDCSCIAVDGEVELHDMDALRTSLRVSMRNTFKLAGNVFRASLLAMALLQALTNPAAVCNLPW